MISRRPRAPKAFAATTSTCTGPHGSRCCSFVTRLALILDRAGARSRIRRLAVPRQVVDSHDPFEGFIGGILGGASPVAGRHALDIALVLAEFEMQANHHVAQRGY